MSKLEQFDESYTELIQVVRRKLPDAFFVQCNTSSIGSLQEGCRASGVQQDQRKFHREQVQQGIVFENVQIVFVLFFNL